MPLAAEGHIFGGCEFIRYDDPGNNGQDRDPWGSSKPGGNSEGNGNKGGRDQGPPDLDDIFRSIRSSGWHASKPCLSACKSE